MNKGGVASSASTVRLHITPFSPALLDSILPGARKAEATSISYHSTQSDPDKGFGFIELPSHEADKLRSKLNGAILRGTKMSIEKARPEKRKSRRKDEEEEVERPQKKARKRIKPDDANKEISGVELPADRKVKRGWTEPNVKPSRKDKEPKDSKTTKEKKDLKREKSKYTDKEELLFRTGKRVEDAKSKSKTETKSAQTKPLVVHEFEKSTKVPTFLKQTATAKKDGPLTFDDEKQGWVDEAGNVVEAVRSNRPAPTKTNPRNALGIEGLQSSPLKSRIETPTATPLKSKRKPSIASSGSDSSSDIESASESDSSDDSESDSDADPSSSESSEDVASDPPVAGELENPPSTKIGDGNVIAPSTELATPALDGAADGAPSSPQAIHPLEALYKRRPDDVPKPAPIQTSFSFFEAEEKGPAAAQAGSTTIPQTPFTQQDLRFRGMRSAAPTPDTAVASRKFFEDDDDDDDSEDEDDDSGDGGAGALHESSNAVPAPAAAAAACGGEDEGTAAVEKSAWKKGFYERRSELNQGWKQRRREAMKGQRQRENRSTSRRAL